LVLVQLFHHRKSDSLPRFLRFKKRNLEQRRELHEIYRLVRERNLLNRSDVIRETAGTSRMHRWFARWCRGPRLRLTKVKDVYFEPNGFVVDLGCSDGFKRAPGVGGDLLYLDSSPLSVMIDQEIASLRDGAVQYVVTPAVRAGQLALLTKLAILFCTECGQHRTLGEAQDTALKWQSRTVTPRR
jgi:hypothetical protein